MTADLSGRDLDVAVARALGHDTERKFVKAWDGKTFEPWMVYYAEDHWQEPHVDSYSTDPTTLDEMLAWLLSYGCFDIMVTPDGVSIDFSGFNTDHDCRVQGKDINEATARLVVAVKEAMGDG